MGEAQDGSLLAMFGYDRLAAIDPKTGDERWSYDTNKTGFWDPQPVIGPDGSIFTFRKDKLAVLDAKGKEKFKCRVGEYSPSILGIDQTGQSVVKSGKEKWSMDLPPGTHAEAQAATEGGTLFVQTK